jgi:hypothetical protein
MSGKKVCVNCSTAYYTGKEQSPLHFGLSAEGYEINSIMEGFDKELWIVDLRNSKKVWTKKEHINKMTYEIPLINEFTDTTEVSKNETSVTVGTAVTVGTVGTSVTSVTAVDTVTVATVVTTLDTVTAVTAVTAVETTNANSDISGAIKETDSNEDTTTNAKVSKKIKPTDYTLFITYRIHQMKLTSTDNKKNYDCAREEWKEYKKTPDKLRDIMIEANNFTCASK